MPNNDEYGGDRARRRRRIRAAVKALDAWEATGNPRNLKEAISVLQAALESHSEDGSAS